MSRLVIGALLAGWSMTLLVAAGQVLASLPARRRVLGAHRRAFFFPGVNRRGHRLGRLLLVNQAIRRWS